MILQFPQIEIDDSLSPNQQIKQIKDILTDLCEKLTFVLDNIDTDNLSPNLLGKIGSGGDDKSSPSPTISLGAFLKKAEAADTYLSKAEAQTTYATQQTVNSNYQTMVLLYQSLDARVTALEQRT